MVSLAKGGDFDAIADLNVEAYQEFAVRMSPDGWRDMEASLRAVEKGKGDRLLSTSFRVPSSSPQHRHETVREV